MNLSVFDVIGPVMVGPSSSHTAGAARIGLLARRLLGEPPVKAAFGLHGSFAATGKGHATDRALVAGVLDLPPDHPDLPRAPELAAQAQIEIAFETIELGESSHPNTARVTLNTAAGHTLSLTASSLGGGIIEACELDGYPTAFRGDAHTLVCWHEDRGGFLARVTALLACVDINIATLRTSRLGRGNRALTVIETDSDVPEDVRTLIARLSSVSRLRAFAPLP